MLRPKIRRGEKPKAPKSEVRYTSSGTDAEHCGNCRNFIRPNVCAKVAGAVTERGWCKLWAGK